jgi:hypothetical protein
MLSMTDPDLKDDVLTGAAAIAAHIGWDVRKLYYAASKGYLPVSHVGQTLVARKSELGRALSAERVAARDSV